LDGFEFQGFSIETSTLYQERLLGRPDNPEDLRNELVRLSGFQEVTPGSRIYWVLALTNKEQGRNIAVTLKFFVSESGLYTLESIRPSEVETQSEEEIEQLKETGATQKGGDVLGIINAATNVARLVFELIKQLHFL
jgi:hypothetical protein